MTFDGASNGSKRDGAKGGDLKIDFHLLSRDRTSSISAGSNEDKDDGARANSRFMVGSTGRKEET